MTPAVPSQRRPDLDWIRVGAFFLLILYHVGMFYVPWDWHVKSPHPIVWLQPVMLLTNPWRLTLLFLVSGAATRFMADKLSAGGLAQARLSRLAPPLLLAVFVIVPPQTYLQIVEQAGYTGSFLDFYGHYATASGHWRPNGAALLTPTYNHMWFVAYLLIYSLILAAILPLVRSHLPRMEQAVEKGLSGWGLLVWPFAAFAAMRLVLGPMFEVTHALVDDWYNHAQSFAPFLFGFLIAKSEPMKRAFIRHRWPALACTVVGYVSYAAFRRAYGDIADAPQIARLLGQGAFALDQWCAIAAVLGFGGKHLTRGGPALDYLTQGVFPFYIVHQTVIVVSAHYLSKAGLPQGLEAAILVAGTFCACFATYEVVRRVNLLRPLFGLKALPREPVQALAVAPSA